ncbi:MAG: glycosyltransferase family 39 protein, partial [Bacteroidia bacterium]|nr:glycosyltransferase family 39 protein [Bacteroidia bacterium]
MKNLRNWFIAKFSPLQQLLVLGLIFRLIAVVFSKGFAWHDDHFLIIESSQSWVDGYHNFWLPTEAEPNRQPQGHALFYIGIHFYIFKFFKLVGLVDPQVKMMIIRLLHALWSLLIISFGYKIAQQYANKKVAWYLGLFLSLYWFIPFVSVRNLVEFVCVPPLLIAIYRLGKETTNWKDFLVAGLWLGIAFSIRFQSVFITAGIGLALLILKKPIKLIALMTLIFFVIVFLSQGLVDYIIWKRPFAEFMSYVEYNVNNATAYGTDNWHMYFDLIFGLLVPPLSFLIFAGYLFTWKKIPLLFWPVFLYLAFHTYFPNK